MASVSVTGAIVRLASRCCWGVEVLTRMNWDRVRREAQLRASSPDASDVPDEIRVPRSPREILLERLADELQEASEEVAHLRLLVSDSVVQRNPSQLAARRRDLRAAEARAQELGAALAAAQESPS